MHTGVRKAKQPAKIRFDIIEFLAPFNSSSLGSLHIATQSSERAHFPARSLELPGGTKRNKNYIFGIMK